jgi:hypothetical protein
MFHVHALKTLAVCKLTITFIFPCLKDIINVICSIHNPLRIGVRMDPSHPLVCRKRRLNGAVLRMRPEKRRSRVTAGVVL